MLYEVSDHGGHVGLNLVPGYIREGFMKNPAVSTVFGSANSRQRQPVSH